MVREDSTMKHLLAAALVLVAGAAFADLEADGPRLPPHLAAALSNGDTIA